MGFSESAPGAGPSDIPRERRSKFEIVAKLLDIASGGSTKTALVYKSNLNFKIAQKYVDMLTRNQLLEGVEEGGFTIYRTTEKGGQALMALAAVAELVSGDPEADQPPLESRWRNSLPRFGTGFGRRAPVVPRMVEPFE